MATLNLLIVDDEPGIRSGIRRILTDFCVDLPFLEEEFGFNIIDAGSGEEAIDIIEKNAIDIVLLDNKLPGMDGIEVLEYINKKQYDCNVMMITSYASLDLAIKATNNGAYNFVPKPYSTRAKDFRRRYNEKFIPTQNDKAIEYCWKTNSVSIFVGALS